MVFVFIEKGGCGIVKTIIHPLVYVRQRGLFTTACLLRKLQFATEQLRVLVVKCAVRERERREGKTKEQTIPNQH